MATKKKKVTINVVTISVERSRVAATITIRRGKSAIAQWTIKRGSVRVVPVEPFMIDGIAIGFKEAQIEYLL